MPEAGPLGVDPGHGGPLAQVRRKAVETTTKQQRGEVPMKYCPNPMCRPNLGQMKIAHIWVGLAAPNLTELEVAKQPAARRSRHDRDYTESLEQCHHD
jgi:hypothetical protein